MGILLFIILSPLIGFLFSGIFGRKLPKLLTGWISSVSVLVSFLLSANLYFSLKTMKTGFKEHLFSFLNTDGLIIGFDLQADRLTSVMMLIITGIGFLIHVYSISYMKEDDGFYKFFAFLNLFIFNMLVLVMGANFLMLFFGWEGVGLCSYLLIGFWYKNAEYGKAARKAFVMNRIGDLGLLIGLFIILFQFGSLDYDTVFSSDLMQVKPAIITVICLLLFIGAIGKSAQIPLFTWLPDAMAGPTPVSALIHAATMVTAGVYMVVRCHVFYDLSLVAKEVILWTGMATSIMAALIGLKQNDIKKVLAYSTVSQLGLMFIALGLGAYTAAMFHLVTHAFFKALLFLGSGSVIHAMGGEQDIRKMGGLKKYIPVTYWTFLIGTLAISGFPFLSGFFSKDEILAEAYNHNVIVWILTVGSAGLTCIYMFRVFMVTFLGSFRGTEEQKHHLHESPILMTLPLIILAIFSVFGGILNLPPLLTHSLSHGLVHWLEPVLGSVEHGGLSDLVQLNLVAVAVLVFVVGFLVVRWKYIKKASIPESDENQAGAGKLLANKFYVDEFYDVVIAEPVNKTGEGLYYWIDRSIIDGIVNGTGRLFAYFAKLYSKLQNGNVEFYLWYMVIGIIVIIGINLIK